MDTARLPEELDAGPLVLRRWREEHIDAVVAAVTESLAELRPWMAWAGGDVGPGERGYLRQAGPRFDEGREFAYGIFDRGAEIGYWVHSHHTTKGYATLAAGALTDATFAHLPEVALTVIHCDAANRASARVAEKLGYLFAGEVQRDIVAPGQTGRGMVWVRLRRQAGA